MQPARQAAWFQTHAPASAHTSRLCDRSLPQTRRGFFRCGRFPPDGHFLIGHEIKPDRLWFFQAPFGACHRQMLAPPSPKSSVNISCTLQIPLRLFWRQGFRTWLTKRAQAHALGRSALSPIEVARFLAVACYRIP